MISETKRVKHELEMILGKIIVEEEVEAAFEVYEETLESSFLKLEQRSRQTNQMPGSGGSG